MVHFAIFDKVKAEGQIVGYIIAFRFGKGAIEEVARLKNTERVLLKLVKVEDIVPYAVRPELSVKSEPLDHDKKGHQKFRFKATAHSAIGIEFYSWDFNFDAAKKRFQPEILLDKLGKVTYSFSAGTHLVAVKVVDNNGLETMKVITIKI